MSVINVVHPAFEIMKSDLDNHENVLILEKIIRTCYRSEGNISEYSHRKMIQKIIEFDHTAMLEHLSITVKLFVDRGCYSDDTEVLTSKGWKLFKDVEPEDLLFCLDDNGKVSFENQTEEKVEKRFKGDLLHFETTNLDLLVTPDHRMWVYDYDKRSKDSKIWKFLRADELKNSRYVFNKTCSYWSGEIGEVLLNEHPTKKYAFPERIFKKEELGLLWELLGLWVTDGSYNTGKGKSGSSIVITQTKENGVSRIKHLCDELGFSYNIQKASIKIGNLQLLNFVESLFGKGPKSTTCFVPKIIKNSTSDLIRCFLNGVILGNGSTKPDGYSCVYTASKKFADDLQELFVKVGVSANIRECEPRNRIFPGKTEKTICTKKTYIVSVCREKKSKPMLDKRCAKNFGTKTKYDGFVYCLTVPGHRLYVRRNGKAVWCGNCTHEAVRHRLCAFAQSSTRYIDYTSGLNVVKPAHISMIDIEEILDVSAKDYPYFISQVSEENKQRIEEAFLFLNSCRTSFLNYLARIKNGASRSQARGSLCHHTQAELVITTNLREWMHIFKLRDDKAAHQDFRLVINAVRNHFAEKYPMIFTPSKQLHFRINENVYESGKWLVIPEEEYMVDSSSRKSLTIPVS